MRLLEALAEWARRTPDALALEDPGGEKVTYAGLATLTHAAAAALRRRGIGHGSRVGLILPRSTDLVVMQLAVLRAGAAFVPMDPAQPTERLRMLLKTAAPDLLVTGDGWLAEADGGRATDVADLQATARSGSLDTAEAGGPAGPDDPAYCLFTSGSTGSPAGAVISRRAMDHYVTAYAELAQCRPSDRAAQLGSPGFDVSVEEIWPFLYAGATVTIAADPARSSPQRLAAWLRDSGITTAFVPPLLLEAFFRMTPAVDLGAVRLLRTGGERLAGYPPEGFPYRVLNEYGPTETVVAATYCDVSSWQDRDIMPPIGRPLPHIRLSVRDQDGTVVAPGTPGELYIGGPTLAIGYLDDEERTARRFVRLDGERWFRTGDIVRTLPSGALAFLHRADEQVQLLGKRVEIGEVEAALGSYPAVRRAAVLAVPDSAGRADHLVCYVRWADDVAGADPVRLRTHLEGVLPGYMLPAAFHEVDDFPVTRSGKVDKGALVRLHTAATHPPAEATDAVLDSLVRIWEDALSTTGLTPEDDLFEHGGTSLQALEIVATVHERLERTVSIRNVFDHPTPRALARLWEGDAA